MIISVRPVRWLAGIAAGLVFLHLFSYFWLFAFGKHYFFLRLFDLNREANVPTFFATGILAFSALLLWIVGQQSQPNFMA